MIELRTELSFAFKPAKIGRFLSEFWGEDLNYSGPVKFGIESLVNCPLTPGADLLQNFVLVNLRTNHIRMYDSRKTAKRPSPREMNDYPRLVAGLCKAARQHSLPAAASLPLISDVSDRQTAGQSG